MTVSLVPQEGQRNICALRRKPSFRRSFDLANFHPDDGNSSPGRRRGQHLESLNQATPSVFRNFIVS